MNRLITYTALALTLCLFSQSAVCREMSGKKKKETAATAKVAEKKISDYDKLFKGKKVKTAKGVMTLHMVDGELLVELPLQLLKRDMMVLSAVSEISDHTDCYVGNAPLRPLHIFFDKIGKSIVLRRDRSQSIAAEINEQEAVNQSNMPSILGSYEIKAWSADSTAVVFNMTSYFTGNEDLLNPIDPRSESKAVMMGVNYRHSKEKSFLDDIKAFADNVSVSSYMTYDATYKSFFNKVTTARTTRTLVLLPEVPMRPRLADYRLPLNVLGKFNFKSGYELMNPVYYATRWRMEPSDQAAYDRGEKVEPKAPILFYIDTVFTNLVRESITAGILEWNKTFEAIGFKSAIQIKPFPKNDPEFDPDNFKYNCIRYVPSLAGDTRVRTYTDPRSGEILRTSILVCHNYVFELPFEVFVFTAHADPSVRSRYMADSTMREHIKNHFMWLSGVDCFGMSYNLTSSAAYSVDSLRNAAFTQKYGTCPSALDIANYNFIAPIDAVKKGFRITPVGVGEYDYHVVKCLYKPIPEAKTSEEEFKVIEGWVDAKVGNPIYRYENAKDCPDCGANDVGNDDLKVFTYAMENVKYCMENFESWIKDEEDKDYTFRQGVYQYLYRRYKQLITQVIINAYGVKTYEKKSGDPVPTYEFTPRARQQAAINMLFDNLYMPAWVIRPKMLACSGISRARIEDHKDYMQLLMTAAAGRLFMYEGLGKEHIGHTEYVNQMYKRLFAPTRKGMKLRDEDFYYQTNFVKTMMLSSRMIDKQSKYNSASTKKTMLTDIVDDPTLVDLGDPQACMEFADKAGLLYQMVDDQSNPETVNAQYGTLKKWPVINVQPSRQTYYEILKDIRRLVRPLVNTGDMQTRRHYQYMIDTIDRLFD